MSGIWYDYLTEEIVFPDNSRIPFHIYHQQTMTHPGLNSYTGLGGLHGGYRTPTQTTYSSSPYGTYSGDPRVQAQLAASQQAALNFANYRPGGLTYTSTSGIGAFGYPCPPPQPQLLPIVKSEGIKSGEIIAHRCWLVKNKVLYSTYTEVPWDIKEPMTGTVGNHEFGYGVHAFKEEHKAREYAQMYSCSWNVVVLGKVKLWGEVVEHERGYRAENARVMSLDEVICSVYGGERILRSIRKRYGVNEYANGNSTDSRQVGPGDGKEAGSIEGLGRDDIPSVPGNTRKGGCWNYLRGLIQGRGV